MYSIFWNCYEKWNGDVDLQRERNPVIVRANFYFYRDN
jgi:hypothetical protein